MLLTTYISLSALYCVNCCIYIYIRIRILKFKFVLFHLLLYFIYRTPVDKTFITHTKRNNVYRFSISPLNMGVPQVYIHCKSLVTIAVSLNDDIGNDQLSDPELSMYTVDSTARVYTLDSTASLKVCY